tara:strand:- start:10505 stop:10774 length:270 start_codon:yes stop_codon:yes gene_type:complete
LDRIDLGFGSVDRENLVDREGLSGAVPDSLFPLLSFFDVYLLFIMPPEKDFLGDILLCAVSTVVGLATSAGVTGILVVALTIGYFFAAG